MKIKSPFAEKVFLLCIVVFSFFPAEAFAQQYVQHQPPTLIQRGEKTSLEFNIPGLRNDQVDDIYLMSRLDGELAYSRQRASLERNYITTDVTVRSTSGRMEYYLLVEFQDGSRLTYPQSDPEERPVAVNIVEQETRPGSGPDIKYNILTPSPGEQLLPDDAFIALTLFYSDEAIRPDSFRVYFDGRDVSEDADISPYFISYIPDRLPFGEYEVRIAYETEDASHSIASWGFEVINPRMALMPAEQSSNLPAGRIELQARNQTYSGMGTDIYQGNVRLSGSAGNIHYSVSGLLTSQETSRLQPQNRLAAHVHIDDWFRFEAGHVYPELNPLLIAGRRMFGINTSVSTPDQSLNLKLVYGNLSRSVDLLHTSVSQRIDTLTVTSGGEAVTDTAFVMGLTPGGHGTYERKAAGARLGFGSGRVFQLGLNALKVEDDPNSIDVIRRFEDIPDERLNELNAEQRQLLTGNPDLFRFEGTNPLPRGNFIFGTDLRVNAHDSRIQLHTDVAASLYNTDISDGILDQSRAEDLGFNMDSGFENMLDRLSMLIIINEKMNTLPLRFENNEIQPFVPMGIFAGHSRLALSYLRNHLTIQYRWVGPDYVSLANSSIRRDISGYTLTDRFRLVQNTVYVTLGHERLQDNVVNNRDATTVRTSYKANVSWYPLSPRMPRVNVGVTHQKRDNSVARENPYLDGELLPAAVRNVTLAEGEPRLLPNPRSARTLQYTGSVSREFDFLDIIHDASFNFSSMKTVDDVFLYGDYDNRSWSLAVSSRFRSLPLRTNVAFSANNINAVSGLNTMTIAGVNLGGSYYLIDNRLNVYADFAVTRNTITSVMLRINDNDNPNDFYDNYYEPDEDSIERGENHSYNIRSGLQYTISPAHSLVVSMNLTNIVDHFGLEAIPNDRVMQARYIYNF